MSVLPHLIPAYMSIRNCLKNKITEPWILISVPVGVCMSELTHLSKTVLLVNRLCLYLQHDRVPQSFNRAIKMNLSLRFPGRWTGRGGPQHWPPTYPGL
jgi:hypothetical protein